MILHRLDIENFQAITSESITFGDSGITLIEGPNESGKSTVLKAFGLLVRELPNTSKPAVHDGLRADASGPITVSAEMTLDGMRVRYSKSFKKRSGSASLTFLSPVRSPLSGREAHDFVLARVEENGDLSLWEKLRLDQERPAGQLGDVGGMGVLTRALDTAAGEDRPAEDDALIVAVREERNTYLGARGGAIGELKRLEEEVAAHEALVAEARREARDLDADLTEMSRLGVRLREKREMVAEAKAELGAADVAAEALREAAEQKSRFDERKALVEARRDNALHESRKRAELVESVERHRASAEGIAEEIAGATTGAAAANERKMRTAAAVEEAEETLRRCAEQVASTSSELEALEARRESDALAERLRGVEESSASISEIAARIDGIPADEEYLAELRTRTVEVRERAAAVQAGTSRIGIGGSGTAVVDGESVDAGAGWEGHAESTVSIEIGEVRVTVTPPATAEDAREAHAEAERRLAAHLSERGYESVAAAERDVRLRDELTAELAGLRGRRDSLLEGTTGDALREKLAGLRRQAEGAAPQSGEPVDVEARRMELRSRREEHSEARAEAETALAGKRTAAELARDEATEARGVLAGLEARRIRAAEDLSGAEAALAEARESRGDAAVEKAAEEAEKAVAALGEESEARASALAAAEREAALHSLPTARASLERHDADVRALGTELSTLEGRVRFKGGQGLGTAVRDAEMQLADTTSRRDAVKARADAADLLLTTLEKHRSGILERYSAPLREALRHYGRLVFGADFDVSLNEKLEVSARRLGETTVDYPMLSGGAKEQFAVITRLVCLMLVGGEGVPVFLDDTMGYSDPERRRAMAAVLADVAKTSQVIVLTCDESRFASLGEAHRHSLG